MQEIRIHTEFIKLQQILKLAGIIGQGSDAKAFIAEGLVYVNGVQALERGKKIRPNDEIEVKGFGTVKVIGEEMN
jgi:ribosome-associated protein